MENPDFPSNSREPKPSVPEKTEPKRVLKVVTGEVTRKKKTLGSRFAEMFFGEDAKNFVRSIMNEIMIPAARDSASQGIDRLIFGESRGGPRRSSSSRGHYPYNERFSSESTRSRRDEPRTMSRRARASHDFDEVVLASRGDANEVIAEMFEMLAKYGTVSVTDLYELVGITGSYTDEKWGWNSLRGADVRRVSSGFLLMLPKPEYLED